MAWQIESPKCAPEVNPYRGRAMECILLKSDVFQYFFNMQLMPLKLPWWVKLISYQLYVTFSSHERPHDKVNTRSNQTDLIPKLRGFAMTFKRGRRALQICMDLRTHCVNNCQFLSRQTEPLRDPG